MRLTPLETPTLTLTEQQTAQALALGSAQRDALRRLVPELTVTPSLDRPGRYDVTPGPWVGALQLAPSGPTGTGASRRGCGLAVQIRPKLPMASVLFLLAYTLDPRAWRSAPVDLAATSLADALVPALVALTRAATRRGLLHGYRSEDASLTMVRGRIRLDDQVRRRWGSAPPVEVRYDDFTADVLENRLLKAALLRAQQLCTSPACRDGVAALLARFAPVGDEPFQSRHVPVVPETPLNAHYAAALRLARLVLAGTSVDLGHGQAAGTAFLVDMNQLFEDFVVVALRQALGLDEQTFPQQIGWRHGDGGARPGYRRARHRRLPLDASGSVHLRPDLSWWEHGRCCFAGDAKYKRARAAGPIGADLPDVAPGALHADLYQLLAYTVAAGLPGGLLVYAGGGDQTDSPGRAARRATDTGDGRYHITAAGTTLYVAALDLSQPPAHILQQVEALARRVRALRDQAVRRHPARTAAHEYGRLLSTA